MPKLDFFTVFLLLVSPATGSFLGVLIDRLPRGEDVVRARSACRACGRALRPRDLLPVLSFVMARGRCRGCGAAIPAWHLYLEIAAPGLAVLALLAGGGAAHVWLTALVLWLLLALAVSDLIWMRLPDVLTLALALAALVRAGLAGHAAMAGLGAVLGAGSFWVIRRGYARLRGREGLGLGDVKLMAGIGAFCGPGLLPHVVLAGALLGVLAVLVAAVRSGQGPAGDARQPFGAALAAAAALVWLWTAAGLTAI